MKFAKELEQDLVPEWRIKYLNYKAGKKYVKGVSRAINKANGTPYGVGRKGEIAPRATPTGFSSPFVAKRQQNRNCSGGEGADEVEPALSSGPVPKPSQAEKTATDPRAIPARNENQSLTMSLEYEGNYGSFVPTPPSRSSLTGGVGASESRHTFELPGPAMRIPSNTAEAPTRPPFTFKTSFSRLAPHHSVSLIPAALSGVDDGNGDGGGSGNRADETGTFPRRNSGSAPGPGRLRRMFSTTGTMTRKESNKAGYDMQAFDVVRQKEQEFFSFLDSELDKVETFYKQKEEQAGVRLSALREQLHEMRNRRTEELAEIRRRKERGTDSKDENKTNRDGKPVAHESSVGWIDPIKSKIFKPGPNSKALLKMPRTPVSGAMGGDARQDYIRRPHDHNVPYRTAKRKLKLALQEFYRGLELLKAFALLNRTAFRKLNKKYDKAVGAKPPYRYMNDKVNKSWFVNSDIVDGHITAVEDLYARYFEKGNHKVAAGKLRRATRRPGDESGSTFLNGLFIGTGAVLTLQGLVYGAQLLFDDDPVVREHTIYLMQIYGGYFLMLFLFSLFCINCYIWAANKVNYQFIFEFDARHTLDWRELSQFPSFCLLLLGICIWLNFTRYGAPEMYLYYPVVLIFLTLVLILLPAPVLGHRSRRWFAYAHYRLFFAGLYPVEFRDFFLGDIYCSLTYATCNIELFFCLYAHSWSNPTQCNSNHSRLLGFFSALPPIWRALQCVRRYADTKNVFPHLVNCGKYSMTIMAAVTLSLYRMNGTTSNLALFATFSIVNSIYCSVWDLLMDFSLLQPDSRHPFLRDILALKRRWVYYLIMTIDPILRFAWIFYAIFTHDKQHSTAVSFLVALAEVSRRGAWVLLRVENEHCGNVAQYKASRDVPLPYCLDVDGHEPLLVERASTGSRDEGAKRVTSRIRHEERAATMATSVDVGTASSVQRNRDQVVGMNESPTATATGTTAAAAATAGTPEEGGLRRRRRSDAILTAGGTIRKIMAQAHRQDFEKKRKPGVGVGAKGQGVDDTDDADVEGVDELPSDEEDDDDEDDSGSVARERVEVRKAETLVKGEGSSDDER